jgi:hypothetical protein
MSDPQRPARPPVFRDGDRPSTSSVRSPSRTTAKRWTPARQAAFLRALKETESVSAAAAHVGMSRQSAYKLRRRMAGQPFDRGWEMAVEDLRLDEALEPMAGSGRCPVCGASPARPRAAPPGRGRW